MCPTYVEALAFYYSETARGVSPAEAGAARRRIRTAGTATIAWAFLALASVVSFVLLLGDFPRAGASSALIGLGLSLPWVSFVFTPLWIYLAARSGRIRRAAAALAYASEIRVFELWPEWPALSREKSQARLDADEAIFSLTRLDVELDPSRMPSHLEVAGDRLLTLNGKFTRDFRWLTLGYASAKQADCAEGGSNARR